MPNLKELDTVLVEKLRGAFGRFVIQEPKGEIIYQNPTGIIARPKEAASQLERMVVYWDLKESQKAEKYGQIPGDYLLVFPMRKDEVNEDALHPILNGMKGKMHYLCAQKLGYNHAVTFTPTCYYPASEALLVRVEPEESIVAPNSPPYL